MTRMNFVYGETYAPGTWKSLKVGKVRSASLNCPLCGEMGLLTDHTIQENGDVDPSVICSNDICTFHEYISLTGWSQGRQSTQEMKIVRSQDGTT